MPIVPIEENGVGLASATDAKFRAPDTSGSGLEALGAGLVQLGAGGQQFASGIEERRRLAAEAIAAAMLDDRHRGNIDDAAVKKAYVDYSDLTHEALHGDEGLFNQQGAGAYAAFPGLVETLIDNHDKSLSKLDDIQRAAVAPAMNERLRSDVERAADHVRQQGMAEQKWQSEQLQKAAARDAMNHADDPELFDHHLVTGENTIRQQAKIDNVSDKLLVKQIADYRSGVHADTIDALTQRDLARAAGWYARYGDSLNQHDKMRVEAWLKPALADARATADVGAANAGDPMTAPFATPQDFLSLTSQPVDLPGGQIDDVPAATDNFNRQTARGSLHEISTTDPLATASASAQDQGGYQKVSQDWGTPRGIIDPLTHLPVRNANGGILLWPSGINPVDVYNSGLSNQPSDAISAGPFLFSQNGYWDFQRGGSKDGKINHPEFVDASTVVIGLYNAAAKVPLEVLLNEQNQYAHFRSHYGRNVPMDKVYTHLPARNVRNTIIGYQLAANIRKAHAI